MVEELKRHVLKGDGKFIPQRINEKYLKKHGLYDYVSNSFDTTYTLFEKIYCLVNNLDKRKTCKICGNEIKFNHGYANYCSRKCSNKDTDVKNKIRKSVSKSLKNAYKEKGDEIKEKRSKTLFKIYGEKTNSPFGVRSIQKEIKQTNIKKFGVENIFYLKKYRYGGRKISQERSIKKNKIRGYDVEYLDKNIIKVKNYCKIHGDVTMNVVDFYNRTFRDRKGIKCPICNPIKSFSSLELEIENILNEFKISNYIKNTKKVIPPYEIDFYFSEYNLAIECNGIYWHSELYKSKNYHKLKTDLCRGKDIQLLHIWEDDLYEKYDIIKSMLKNKFNLNYRKIYARKCELKIINSQLYKNFLIENHIQGKINSSIKYGLFYENEIVAVMGFGKLRRSLGSTHKENDFELHRFCTKKDYNIIGGASKLLNHFEKNNNYKNIFTYAKKDYSNGKLYEKLGFTFEKECNPGYYWIENGKRKHRFNFRKDKIVNENNKHLTEIEIMHQNGYLRCFDSGNLKYKKIN